MTKSLSSYSLCLPLIFSLGIALMSREIAFADSWKDLMSGDQAAQEFLNKLDQKKNEAGAHPFYTGIPKEANFTSTELNGKGQTLSHKDPAGQMVHESAGTRPHIKVDPEHDPLLARSKEVLASPLDAIGGKGTTVREIVQGGKDEILTCEEPGEDTEHTCKAHLIVTLKEAWGPEQQGSFETSSYSLYGGSGILFRQRRTSTARQEALRAYISSHYNIPLQSITKVNEPVIARYVTERGKHWKCTYPIYLITYAYRKLTKEPSFSWENDCGGLEEKVDQGLCSYVSKVCSIGKQTRIIQGVSVTQDCWQETFTYGCFHPSKDDCGPLRARGCVQINSTCKQKVGNVCVVYNQTYQCKGASSSSHTIVGGQTPFCMDGNCRDQGWENNDEMMSTVAQLSLLKEMQGKPWNGTFFTGTDHQCSKYILNFKDCCGSGNGWGKSVGLAGDCKPKEKALSLKRKARLCHYVGTYCDKKDKITGKCIKKKSSFCCFGSKLLKAFHEQGRPQIGMGWGSAKEPLCRGFTIDEIQRIDFSKLDLSEVFEDLIKTYQPGKLQGTGKTIGDRLEQIKRGLNPARLNPPGLSPPGLVPEAKKQPPQRDPA